jgi:hypothetical protein
VKKADVKDGLNIVHHYHELALKSHDHYSINTDILQEYHNKITDDIRAMVKELGPIGNPYKYQDQEKTNPERENYDQQTRDYRLTALEIHDTGEDGTGQI